MYSMSNYDNEDKLTFALVAAIITTLAVATTISTTSTSVYARGCEKHDTCGQDPDPGDDDSAEIQKEADDAAAEANEIDVD